MANQYLRPPRPSCTLAGRTRRNEWSGHLEGIGSIFAFVEPDAAGEKLADRLATSPLADRLRFVRLNGAKDPSELHLQTSAEGGFLDAWDSAVEVAEKRTPVIGVRRQAPEKGREPSRSRPFWDPEPWPEPPDGAGLLDEVRGMFERHITAPEESLTALTLWTALTWVYDRYDFATGLVISSPEKRCGKTRALEVSARMAHRPILSFDASIPSIYRAVDEDGATLLLDEVDRIKNREKLEDITRLLNGSTSRSFGWVERCEPSGRRIERRSFRVFGPKAIAGIDLGTLPDTFLDRSVHIVLQRRVKQKDKARLRRDETRFDELRRRLARWTGDVGEKLGDPEFQFPDYTSERHEEAWEPLLEIAEVANGRWPKLADQACKALTRPDEEAEGDSWKVALLNDCRRIYWDESEGPESIGRDRLCERLRIMEEPSRSWADSGKEGKGLTPSRMRAALRSYGISTRDVRDRSAGEGKLRGYRWDDFLEAWESYLPPRGDS